ncbi:MAG: sialate O-acetylesterase [Planctomycetaceae bacterium]|nr:sialate O-acetylesterase [Planctomycetaceae bacterium]
MRLLTFRVLTATLCLLSYSITFAQDLKLPSVFGSHMVMQREMPVPVWGWAAPDETVTVKFRDQSKTAKADADGKWMVKLDALSLGEPATLTVSGNTDELTFEDVLVGEVWVCSGQSNMQWSVDRGLDPDLEAAAGHRPNIRLFRLPLVAATEPQDDVDAEWTYCTPETLPAFTAVGYNFGRTLQEVLQVPVGLIQTAWGGTRAEAWTSPEMMASVEELKPIIDTWNERDGAYNAEAAQAKYDAELAEWEKADAAAKAEGKTPPRKPSMEQDPRQSQHHFSTLYNAMIAPLSPVAIRGAIWYQGESNASRAYQYRTLIASMIQSWRDDWKQGDFPFYQVQLANFRAITDEAVGSDWAELREAQTIAAQALPNAGVACITDIGAALDIHPKNKQDVGKRLARLALVDNYGYGDTITRSGPTYDSVEFKEGKAFVKFDTHGSSLETWYREPLTGFMIAGEDRNWVWADAQQVVNGDTVEVSSKYVSNPVAVRYNWADNPQGNLFNEKMLPAYPFRSDDWPGVTANNVKP